MEFDSGREGTDFAVDTEFDLAPEGFVGTEIGEQTVRTQAAALGFLEGSLEEGAATYDSISESRGEIRRQLIDQKTNTIRSSYEAWMKEGLMTTLTRDDLSFEDKQRIVNSVQNGALEGAETADILATAAMAAPSKGETVYAEDVRLSSSSAFEESSRLYSERQAIANAVKAQREGGVFSTMSDLLDSFFPTGQGVAVAGVVSEVGAGDGQSLLSLMAPGSSIATLRERLLSLPPEQQRAYFIQLKNAVLDKSGVITKDNQLRAAELIEKLSQDEYSTAEEWVDNVFQILDVVGVGAVLRGAGRARKAAAAAASSRVTSPGVTDFNPMPEARVRAAGAEEAAVRLEYEEAIQTAANKLEPNMVQGLNAEAEAIKKSLKEKVSVADGQMARTLIERRQDMTAQLARIEEQLDMHKAAVQAEAKLAPLEKKMQSLSKSTETVAAKLNPIMESIRQTQMQATLIDYNPRAPGTLIYNNNPEMAANLRHMVFMSEGDDVAKALFGSTKAEALMQGIVPQVTTEAGRVKYAPHNVESTTKGLLAEAMGSLKEGTGGLQYTPKELASARANIVNDFSEALGIKLQPGMSAFRHEGERSFISATYTNGESGWKTAEDAVAQAKYALRERGITEKDMTILKREADEYVPTTLEAAKGKPGDYAIRVDSEQVVNPGDVAEWDKLDVKRNIFDRIFGGNSQDGHGSVQRHLLEPSSMLHQTIAGAASVADDRTSLLTENLLKLAARFSDRYAELSRARQAKMYDYIKEANIKEIPLDRTDLMARGFNDREVSILQSWRDTWDAVYHLENLDLVRSLRGQNYQWFEGQNFSGVVKPIQKNMNKSRVYDPATDTVRNLTKQEMDALYLANGTLADLRRPININGTTVETMIVRQQPGEHARKLLDTDKILTKKDGYYQITYRSPKFIDETVTEGGKTYQRAIGVAGTTKEAQEAIKLLQGRNPGKVYSFRGDERGLRRDSDSYWDLNQVGGRIAQRHRGKLLEDAVGQQLFGKGDFIDSPTDSAVKAIMSISGRSSMRPVLDAAKTRFIEQYKHLLTPDDNFIYRFPSARSDIKMKGEMTTKELADARTTFEYIQYLENGYINAMDDTIKATLNMLSNMAGKAGASRTERGLQSLSEISFTGAVKGGVFASMLALNPMRQWIVQSNQIVRTFAYNPKAWISGDMGTYMKALIDKQWGATLKGDSKDFVDFVYSTGMYQSVTKNNLIRGTLLDLSERRSTVGKIAGKGVDRARQIGFDIGEKTNIAGHAAAVFSEYKRAGKNVRDASVRAEMHAKVRNLTWNMNFAGDMPYNQNALGLLMTYMQVPHKAALQTFNRGLTRSERARLLVSDAVMWGTPLAAFTTAMGESLFPESPHARELVTDGLQSMLLNYMMQKGWGDKARSDFSSLAPYDMDGWRELVTALFFDGGIKGAIDRAPAARVFGLSHDSKTGHAIKMASRYFTDINDETQVDPVAFLDVVDAFGKISSGWSNYQKARAMYITSVARDKLGRPTDTEVPAVTAFMQMLGFGPKSTAEYYDTVMKAAEEVKDWDEQAKKDAQDFQQVFMAKRNGIVNPQEALALASQYYGTRGSFPSELAKQKYMSSFMTSLFSDPNIEISNQLIKFLGFDDPESMTNYVTMSPLPNEDKERILKTFKEQSDFIKGMKE